MTRLLVDLLAAVAHLDRQPVAGDVEITQVTADSRQVQPGALFVAVRGATADGHAFVPDALARGAAAVVGTAELSSPQIPYIRVADARVALAQLAAAWYGFPSQRMRMIGITGTDGKTTTANLIYQGLLAVAMQPGMISTIGARLGREELDTGLHTTTPDAPDVQRFLAEMVSKGCDVAVLEATSHGLHQRRVDACDFDVAVVTNVTHEHLDYHQSWAAYLDAKAILFRSLATAARKPGQAKVAVLNIDDASYPVLSAFPVDQQLSYGLDSPGADLWAEQVIYGADRTSFRVRTPLGPVAMETQLLGRFNVYNCLAALGAGLALGLSPEAFVRGMATLSGVNGRMERIDRGQDFLAIVDFAHTPGSLARALEVARTMTRGQVIMVIGSAGLRDVQKRYLMAETAVQQADFTVLTAEDPRTEALSAILAQMAEGAMAVGGREGEDFQRVPDRTAAIERAVAVARPGDVVLVCGKGHEHSMCFGTVEFPWSDQAVLGWALERHLGQTQAPPPYRLPTSD